MAKTRLKPLDEVAADTGLGRRTLQHWLHDGKLTGYRISGDRKRYVDLDELDRLRTPQPIKRKKAK